MLEAKTGGLRTKLVGDKCQVIADIEKCHDIADGCVNFPELLSAGGCPAIMEPRERRLPCCPISFGDKTRRFLNAGRCQ